MSEMHEMPDTQPTQPTRRPAPRSAAQRDAGTASAPKELKFYDVIVDLGQSTDHMTINGAEFYHGHKYRVREDLLPAFNEIMHNTRMHEQVVKGYANANGTIKTAPRRMY